MASRVIAIFMGSWNDISDCEKCMTYGELLDLALHQNASQQISDEDLAVILRLIADKLSPIKENKVLRVSGIGTGIGVLSTRSFIDVISPTTNH